MSGRIEGIRELTKAEVEGLKWGNRLGGPTINDIRAWHHHMARLLAEGNSVAEVARALGKSYQRVYVISKDPLMQELVAENLERFQAASPMGKIIQDTEETLVTISDVKRMAWAQLRDYLEEAEAGLIERPSPGTLRAIAADASDRSGHGKTATQVNVNYGMDERLDLANIRSNAVRKDNVIELQPLRPSFLPAVEQGQAEAPTPPPAPRKLRRI